MASEYQFECTQIIQTSPSEDATQEQVASLILNGLEHPIFNGTKIGRDPKQCLVAIDRKSVSFHHALIEVELGQHFLTDLGSTNSTHLNGLRLKPNIKYEVPDGAVVQVADLCGTYHILPLKEPELETTAQDIFDQIMSSTLAMNLDESDLADESNFHLYLSTIVDSSGTSSTFEGVTPFVTAKSSLEVSAVSVPSVSEPTGPVFLRRSSRIKERQAKQGKDFSGESQSQESGLPDQVSAASSSDHTKGRKSGRDTKQKVNTKSGPSVA